MSILKQVRMRTYFENLRHEEEVREVHRGRTRFVGEVLFEVHLCSCFDTHRCEMRDTQGLYQCEDLGRLTATQENHQDQRKLRRSQSLLLLLIEARDCLQKSLALAHSRSCHRFEAVRR